jgi:ABC-2 type transport system permease protein
MTAAVTTFGGTRHSAPREFASAIKTIMVKELRSRMRGRRAFIVLTVYLGVLALLTYGTYVVVGPSARDMAVGGGGFFGANASAVIGQSIFIVLSVFQMILVCFITPGFTASQISLEREKQTLDLLISTPLRPAAIVVGKLAAALAFVVLMILSAIPISAIVLMYGGASVDDIFRQQLVLLVAALFVGSIGLFYSALLKRTQPATVLTYITVLFLTIGTQLLFIFWSVVINEDNAGFRAPDRAPEQLMYANPAVAMLDVIAMTEATGGVAILLDQLRTDPLNPDIMNAGPAVDNFGRPINAPTGGYWWPRISITFTVLSVLLTLAATRFVIPAGMRFAFRRRRAQPPEGVAPAPDADIRDIEP